MAVRIRLKRTGTRNLPCFRVVVADARSQRDGRVIEELGLYDPKHSEENIKLERAEYWLSKGAQPSETVAGIIKRARAGVALTKPEPPAQTAPADKAAVRAAAVAEKKAAEDAAAKSEAEKSAAIEDAATDTSEPAESEKAAETVEA